MTKNQAEQFAAYVNRPPLTPFKSATVEHQLALGDNGFYVRLTTLNGEIDECDDWRIAQECMGILVPE